MAAPGFRRTRSGRVVARLDEVERELLASLLLQLQEFVAPADDGDDDPLARMVGIDAEATTPDDPALARLLPDGYGADDPDATAEFRRFTERSLREGKIANARSAAASLVQSGDKLTLSAAQAQAWLGSLNDLRLTLGTRLEITEEHHDVYANLPSDDETASAYHVYDWLTFLQETLVQAVLAGPIESPTD